MKEKFFDAVIFDLDGVITKTAVVHSAAWKEMFNNYLKYRSEKYNEEFREFTHEDDYLPYVDGKPRYKGVADFLASRGIDIPYGDPSDSDDKETVCGLGNLKNSVFNDVLSRKGAEVYDSTLRLIKELKKNRIKLGVASSSKNCRQVLESVGLLDYFETRVDGVVSAKSGLKGKPEPDIFTTACDNLGVSYHRAVVIEDAVSGVQAGRKGKFGMVLGIAREGNIMDLRINGADVVVEDVEELGGIAGINEWFKTGLIDDQWSVSYPDYNTEPEKSREALLTTGNGFFATRGAMEETRAGDFNYPGTYMAGLYNRRKSKVKNKWIENEDFVNFIHWTYSSFRINDGEWFDPDKHSFEIIYRKLDFRNGLLSRKIRVFGEDGKETIVTSLRFVSMADPHIAGISYEIMPVNYSGTIEIKTAIDGNMINRGVDRYNELDQHHLDQDDQGVAGRYPYVVVKTNESLISLVVASEIELYLDDTPVQNHENHKVVKGKVSSSYRFALDSGQTLGITKTVAIYNNRDFNCNNPLREAVARLEKSGGFCEEKEMSRKKWDKIWQEADIMIKGDRYAQKLLRMHIYHLLVTASEFHKHLDAGIPARGLHGEAYRGHIFWDELFIFPFYASHYPETARSVLMYRYRRLEEARRYAASHGYKGAMFPWQSGSNGREETQVIHLNPVSGKWGDDYSSLQRHISAAIAYNIWLYYHFTHDRDFLLNYGVEMFIEICRFWASATKQDGKKFSISGVMGPDEFHEKYPDSDKGGLKNNAYTNIMAAWCLQKVRFLLEELSGDEREKVSRKTGLKKKEWERWDKISNNLQVNISKSGIIEQFEGYFKLKELKLDKYRKKYDDIHRMDRILKAEGKSPDDYKMAKQADTLMLYFNLGDRGADEILRNMGYVSKPGMLIKNFDYYMKRTSHGSTLSRVVHSLLARMAGYNQVSFDLFMEALESDYVDIQGGTTGEGIHAGVMGGTVVLAMTLIAGISWMDETLNVDPYLPGQWEMVSFKLCFKENSYIFTVYKNELQVYFSSPEKKNGNIFIRGSLKTLINNQQNRFIL